MSAPTTTPATSPPIENRHSTHDPLCRFQELRLWTHADRPDACPPGCPLHVHVDPAVDCTCPVIAVIRADHITRCVTAVLALPAHPASHSDGDGALLTRAQVVTAITGTAPHEPHPTR